MRNIIFEKYSASGNDFLITHTLPQIPDLVHFIQRVCNRFEGIGADGVVLLSSHPDYSYAWDFYNSDGSIALMCGNASRCVGLYAYLNTLAPQTHSFLSGAGEIKIEVLNPLYPYEVKSHLGEYHFKERYGDWYLFDTGVPHLITLLANKMDFDHFPLEMMKELRQKHHANINIAYKDQNSFFIKTYERGVEGITLACGTGMASLVALLHYTHDLHSPHISIIPPLGEKLDFFIQNKQISFQGEVKKIAQCKINLNDFGVKQ